MNRRQQMVLQARLRRLVDVVVWIPSGCSAGGTSSAGRMTAWSTTHR